MAIIRQAAKQWAVIMALISHQNVSLRINTINIICGWSPYPSPQKHTHTHKQNKTGTKKTNYFWLTIPSPAPPPPPSPFSQKSQIINRDWPAFQRMLRCSWLELNCLAKRWDSSRQSVYINSWEELRNWYMPWSSCCASWLGSNRWDSSTLPWWREYTVSLYEIQPHLPLWLE